MYRLLSLLFFGVFLAGAPAQAQQAKRPGAQNEAAQRGFGRAVAFSSGEVLVGEASNVLGPGAVYVYGQEAGGWTEQQRLTASDGTFADEFGWSMDVEGDVLLVGAPSQDGRRGAAYVFRRDAASGQWIEKAKLTAQGGAPGDELGTGVVLRGAYALVGAPFADDQAGAAYLFRYDAGLGLWQEEARLTADEEQPGALFGYSAVLTDDEIIISAYRHNDSAGAVFVFQQDETSGAWQQQAQFSGNDTTPNDVFGFSMTHQGDELIVGAPQENGFRGAVYLFEKNATTGDWQQREKRTSSDLESGDLFGYSMAMMDDEMWIGALRARNDLGAAYVFRRDDPAQPWREVESFTGSPAARFSSFGRAVVLDTTYGLVGATGEDFGTGAAYVFERDASDAWIQQARVISSDTGPEAIVGEAVVCAAGKASIFPCGSVDLLAFLPTHAVGGARGAGANDIWGWTDPQTGREYALIGRIDGTSFVDVTDPVNPVYLGNLPTHTLASTWRDVKVYADHAFVVSEAPEHGMQVFDLTQLRAVTNPPVTFSETAHYGGIFSAHNVAINEETGFAYVVGARGTEMSCSGGLHMVDIRDPINPTFAGCFADPATGRGSGYTHDAQCVIYRGPDAEHRGKEICFGSNENALSIADVTDKRAPVALAASSYPNAGYTHQGWLTEDHRYFFQNDELDEIRMGGHTRTLIWDVTDLDDPQFFAEYQGETTSSDHNLYIVGRHVFESNYSSGLRILDITDMAAPREVGYFDVFPAHDGVGFSGSWSNYPFFKSGAVIVTGREAGLFIVKPTAFQVAAEAQEVPETFVLSPAFPNPFNPATTLTLTLPTAQPVTVAAYDLLGREVAVLHRGPLAAGTHRLVFEASNLPSGVYLIRADGPTVSQAQAVTLVR